MTRCPCGTGLAYAECCGPFHTGAAAPTAEALMRSRFSAYARGDAQYIRRTWHSRSRPRSLDLNDGIRWTLLEVGRTTGGGLLDAEGTVEFAAHYRDADGRGVTRELSHFTRESGEWRYTGPV
ncbi:YchJ family metal-binding protein [Rugosimonospora acidiphila]|uniref:YchJ family metal-binding protein n=1 Tax=Rugosimonospora acidiphila TaxID=556531 RepID=A0ABP9RU05_9ACTN